MTGPTKPRLVVREGGRKELGRQLIRAMTEFRSEDVRALADRIARRGSLQSVLQHRPSGRSTSKQDPQDD